MKVKVTEYYWNSFLQSGQVSDYLNYRLTQQKNGEGRRRIVDSSQYKKFY